jgi:hypothetical protein
MAHIKREFWISCTSDTRYHIESSSLPLLTKDSPWIMRSSEVTSVDDSLLSVSFGRELTYLGRPSINHCDLDQVLSTPEDLMEVCEHLDEVTDQWTKCRRNASDASLLGRAAMYISYACFCSSTSDVVFNWIRLTSSLIQVYL